MPDAAAPHVTSARRAFLLMAGLVGLAGLLIQAHVTWHLGVSRGWSAAATVAKYLSYFTLLTNILLAASSLIGAIAPESRAGTFVHKPATASALLVYISIVGIVYVLVLAGLWHPQGLQWWADGILHYATPLLWAAYWITFVPKVRQPWSNPFGWLIYPALYLIWALIYGTITGHYPYPFLDVKALGVGRVALAIVSMTATFLIVGWLVISFSRAIASRRQPPYDQARLR
ncbi:MAG: Pr6Pr family membrane protein [Luteolibacter sp.]